MTKKITQSLTALSVNSYQENNSVLSDTASLLNEPNKSWAFTERSNKY